MMDGGKLQVLVAKGLSVAGRVLGAPYVVYRPEGASQPTSQRHRLIVLNAAFSAPGNGAPKAPSYGQPLWQGYFDARYTQAGDYLVGESGIFFIAQQWLGLTPQCVLTNRHVTIVRPTAAAQGNYSGFFASPGERVIIGWPASLLESGEHAGSAKPAETRLGNWQILLPILPAAPHVADVITDDLGATYVIGTAEESSLGWRLLVRQLAA
jgi:hypothetical protein